MTIAGIDFVVNRTDLADASFVPATFPEPGDLADGECLDLVISLMDRQDAEVRMIAAGLPVGSALETASGISSSVATHTIKNSVCFILDSPWIVCISNFKSPAPL